MSIAKFFTFINCNDIMFIMKSLRGGYYLFKDRLKELREGLGLTQAELAEKLSIGRASVSNYELGTRTPDIETLRVISNFFNVTSDYLVGNSTYKTVDEAYRFKAMEIGDKIEKYNNQSLKSIFEYVVLPIAADIRGQEISNELKLYESLYKKIALIYAISVICSVKDKEKHELLKEYFIAYSGVKSDINIIIDEIAINYINKYFDKEGKAKIDVDLLKLCSQILRGTKEDIEL